MRDNIPDGHIDFKWVTTEGDLDLEASKALIATPLDSKNLVIKPNALVPGSQYTFTLEATLKVSNSPMLSHT